MNARNAATADRAISDRTTARRPYVVSLDIEGLLRRWGPLAGFRIPSRGFFAELRLDLQQDLEEIFPDVELVPESELQAEVLCRAQETGLSVISMDFAYRSSSHMLQATRAVNPDMSDAGVTYRGGLSAKSGSLEEQVRRLGLSLQGDVALVDDVIFSGDLISKTIIPMLRDAGIHVRTVIAGIGIKDGVARVQDAGAEVTCVRLYRSVVDEVCERDFYPGVPFSGRTMLHERDVGMPYLLPFGDPCKWASIPEERARLFSISRIKAAEALFRKIGQISARDVRSSDLPRGVHMVAHSEERFLDVLATIRSSL